MNDLKLDPAAAARIVNGCYALSGRIDTLLGFARGLTGVSASRTYQSGSRVDNKLSDLGEIALRALKMLQGEIDKAGDAARAGGQALINQDDENQRAIAAALNSPDGINPAEKALPGGPIGYPGARSTDPFAGAAALAAPFGKPEAGPFPMNLIPEALPNFSIDPALAALGPAQPAVLTTLSSQWAQLATQLRDAFAAFKSQISVLGTDVFSGVAASQMKQSLDRFSAGGERVANEAQANSAAISAWAGFVATSQAQSQTLEQGRATALAAATPENALQVHQIYDSLSQMQLSATWNPPLGTMNGSIVNLSDPSSPVSGVPLYPPGTGPKPGADGSNPRAVGTYPSRSNGGATTGGVGSNGSAAAAAKADAAQLQQAGSKTAQSAGNAAGTTPPAGAPSSGKGDPISALSQAGKSAEGLNQPAATRSSGLGALDAATAADKDAAQRAAKAGGAGGGGGAGTAGLGKAGAMEGSLSSRSLGSISAAERAMAPEPAGPTPARTAPGTTGAPMGGRGASAGGSESEGKHKSARYLQSTENGEEIVGELDDVAPSVLGGLNLDTSDDPPTPPRSS